MTFVMTESPLDKLMSHISLTVNHLDRTGEVMEYLQEI